MTAAESGADGEVLQTALRLAAAGYALTPVRVSVSADGKKKAQPCLKGWRSSNDPDQIRDWFVQFRPNVWAQVCAASGVDVIDLDAKNDGPAHYAELALPESTMVVDTPGGGWHHVFAADPDRPLGVTAGRVPGIDTRSAGSDTQGGISFIVGVLPDGRWWRPRKVVATVVLPPTPDVLRTTFPASRPPKIPPSRPGGADDPFAPPGQSRTFTRSQALAFWNAQLAEIEAIAHIQGARHQTLVKVTRALGIFDGAVPGIRDATWARLRVALDGQPGVDITAAARTFADIWPTATDRAEVVDDPPTDPFAGDSAGAPAPADGSDIYPDLAEWLDEDYQPEAPEVGLERDDGARLLYAGKWHTCMAESGVGKSWLALWHCVEEMRRGHHVVYAHFEESSPRSTLLRLKALGVSATEIRERFHWLDAGSRPSSARLGEVAPWGVPTLVVLDGINAACGLLGLNPLDVEAVNAYRTRFVTPFTAAGAAVLSLGHPPKARARQEERHGYGSTAWLDLVDGAAFRMRPSSRPIARGRDGYATVYVVKDRPGGVEELGAAETTSEDGAWTYLGAFHLMPPQSDRGNAWGRLSSPHKAETGDAAPAELELSDDEKKFRWLARQGVAVTASVRTAIASARSAPKGSIGKTGAGVIDVPFMRRYAQWWTDRGEEWLSALSNYVNVPHVPADRNTSETPEHDPLDQVFAQPSG